MAKSGDNYASTRENKSKTCEPEPADPPITDYQKRDELPLAPSTVNTDRLPDPLYESGEPLTVSDAREQYVRLEQWHRNDAGSSRTSQSKRHKRFYARILESDRRLQERYDGSLTTAMVTRRLSPLDSQDDWLTPWECNEMLHGGGIVRSVRQAINYHLENYEFEYIAVTSTTRNAATPHEHIYLWIDDSSGDLTPDMLTPALERHIDRCANAYQKDHPVRVDGKGGAITVYHDPPLIKHKPDKLAEILEGDTPNRPNTRGAHYLATQLAHLPAANLCNSNKPEPTNAELDGGVVAWLSPHRWFKHSNTFPT